MKTIRIDSIKRVVKDTTCFDIEVDNDHMFFIDVDGTHVLTHNSELPDVDSDVADRDLVINGMRAKFGEENVIPISNINTLQLKSLTKDVSKFYGIDFAEATAAVSTVEQDVRKAITKAGDDKNLFVLTLEDALLHSKRYSEYLDKYPEIAQHVKTLYKQVRSIGRHAGGVLVAENLQKSMPLIGVKGEMQTPWVEGTNVKHLNEFGFAKFDILGLETLRIIHLCIENILMSAGNPSPTFEDIKTWFDTHLHPDKLDFDDQEVYKNVYHEGRFCATFQFTSQGAQRFIKKFKPSCLEDIAIATSIYRPGPLTAKVDSLYLKAVDDLETAKKNTHPKVWKALESTKGLLIFQEQLMILAVEVAGFSPEDSERVRKTILKQSITAKGANKEKRNQIRKEFVEGCIKHSDMTQHDADTLFDNIEFFCGYGFNRSHAVAYAIDSYYCAYLQTHYEAEWCCAYLQSASNNADKLVRAIMDVRALGYSISKLDINHATDRWSIMKGKRAFVPSFYSCKSLGAAAVAEVFEHRPYKSIEDFLWNEDGTWKHSKLNKKAVEALIKVGAFDSLECVGPDRVFGSYKHMHEVIIENNDLIKKTPKRDPLLGMNSFFEIARALKEGSEEWSNKELAEFKVELTGMLDVTSMFGDGVLQRLTEKGVLPIDEYDEQNIYWFCAQNSTLKMTRNKKSYLQVEAVGVNGKTMKLNVWGWKGEPLEPFSLCVAEVERNDFGFSTTSWKLKTL